MAAEVSIADWTGATRESADKKRNVVLIDGREIAKKRGLGHFLRELLFNINDRCVGDDFTYVCVVPTSVDDAALRAFSNIEFVRATCIEPMTWEQLIVPLYARWLGANRIVCPYNTFPLLTPRGVRRIIVYHDLIFLRYRRIQSSLKLSIGNRYRSLLFRALRRRDIILTVSDYSKALIGRFARREATVIGNNVNHLRAAFSAPAPWTGEAYFLHVGGDASTKNSPLALAAYRLARSRSAADFPGLIVIGMSPAYAARLQAGRQDEPGVAFRFDVSDAEKCRLFANAVAVVFPSLREGFGLPIIEAHACGRRVITSKRRPLVDLAAPGDILVDPTSQEEIAEAFVRCAGDAAAPDLTSGRWAPPDQYQVLRSVLT